MTNDTDFLLRYLEGRTTEIETRSVERRLAEEPEFAERLHRAKRLRAMVQSSRPQSFGPYFSDRVARRLKNRLGSAGDAVLLPMGGLFARLAIAGLLIAASLGAHNVAEYQRLGLDVTVVEAMFGLPGASVIDAVMFDLEIAPSELQTTQDPHNR
jgi:anti-sigma factor RsiW